MTVPQRIATTRGPVEFTRLGEGRPLLFIHGGHASCRETLYQKGLDPAQFCFITPSRPGYGQTPLTAANKSPKGTADLLVALLDGFDIQTVSVVGISAGGLAALELAAHYPDRVRDLTLMSALTKKWLNQQDAVYKKGEILFNPAIEWFTWLLYRVAFQLFSVTMTNVPPVRQEGSSADVSRSLLPVGMTKNNRMYFHRPT